MVPTLIQLPTMDILTQLRMPVIPTQLLDQLTLIPLLILTLIQHLIAIHIPLRDQVILTPHHTLIRHLTLILIQHLGHIAILPLPPILTPLLQPIHIQLPNLTHIQLLSHILTRHLKPIRILLLNHTLTPLQNPILTPHLLVFKGSQRS